MCILKEKYKSSMMWNGDLNVPMIDLRGIVVPIELVSRCVA